MMKVTDFIDKLKNIADNYNTVYGKGGFGHPCTEMTIENLNAAYPDWYKTKTEELKKLVGKQYYIFDCVCLIKAVLFWGWTGNFNATYGGAVYDRNTDYTEKGLLNACSFTSNNFNIIVPGELVYMPGHVGVYIGNGQVVECSSKWKNSVQYSNLGNISKYKTGKYRIWTSHGKLPGVDYSTEPTIASSAKTYTVVKGDSYWSIAEKLLGNGSRYTEIQKLNNSKALYPGDVIKIPEDADTDGSTDKIVVGSKVKVKTGAKFTNGANPASFVYKTVYDVLKISGDKATIGIGTAVTGEMKISNLIIQ